MASQTSWEPSLPVVSVITVARNAAHTICDTIASVIDQTYPNIEYVLVDGESTDETLDIFRAMRHSFPPGRTRHITVAPTGPYQAMNAGIEASTGQIVCFLNADDYYCDPQAIALMVDLLQASDAKAIMADAQFVRPDDTSRRVRGYSSRWVGRLTMPCGVLPAHPAFFAYRECYTQYGGAFDDKYGNAADAELMMRLLGRYRLPYRRLPRLVAHMRAGGMSQRGCRADNRHNLVQAARDNGLRSTSLHIMLKYVIRLFEYL